MNTQEQAYHDHLETLTAFDMAQDVELFMSNDPMMSTQGFAYKAYRDGLTAFNQGEADYRIFASLFDIIDESEHQEHEDEFAEVGQSIDAKCKRKKGTPH